MKGRTNLKILITGPPRSGKSTLIRRILDTLGPELFLIGFLTPEIIENGKRIGFNILDIKSSLRIPLARKGTMDSNYKLGNYNVFIETFEQYLIALIEDLSKYRKKKNEKELVLIIDEIGKMELFSDFFESFIKEVFHSNRTIIATIGEKLRHPIKNLLLLIPEIHKLCKRGNHRL
ncbi:MAG: putative Nucleoside-triphosphatase THEP1 [Promethearchaeota archaeon]|nr:MAG: putative Nucleoside-triphosphatase THEP1 [Candidatus Lokiarchaeota archaeon]